MAKVTAAQMNIVAGILNTHAAKLSDQDKNMIMDIGMAFKQDVEVEQSTFDSWVARMTLIKQIVEHVEI